MLRCCLRCATPTAVVLPVRTPLVQCGERVGFCLDGVALKSENEQLVHSCRQQVKRRRRRRDRYVQWKNGYFVFLCLWPTRQSGYFHAASRSRRTPSPPCRHSALLIHRARARARSLPCGVIPSPRYSGSDCSVVASGNDDSSVVLGAYPGSWGECDTKCGGGTRRVESVCLTMQPPPAACVCVHVCVLYLAVYICLACCTFFSARVCVCLVVCAHHIWSAFSYSSVYVYACLCVCTCV